MSLHSKRMPLYNSLMKDIDSSQQHKQNNQNIEPIRQDYLNGMTYKEIARKYFIDQRTAKRYVEKNLPLSELEHRTFSSILDPFEPVLRSLLASQPVYAKTIFQFLRENGYTGSYSLVNRRVQQIIQENIAAGIYPPECPRSRQIPKKPIPIVQKIKEENDYVTNRI